MAANKGRCEDSRVVGNDLIRVACAEDQAFVYVPPRLDRPYLEDVLSAWLGRRVGIRRCRTTNLCALVWGGVSHSGATVLRLAVEFEDGDSLDVAAKILCPDSVNLFKLDRRFSGRLAEVAWAEWWGRQEVRWAPKVYATRADVAAREFWILQEYFPQVGWPETVSADSKCFTRDRGLSLMSHAADVHAHSRARIGELAALFPDDWPGLTFLAADVAEAMADASFLAGLGVSDHERAVIDRCLQAVERRPGWVDEWELVCVTADIAPDNVGVRRVGTVEEVVTFDWGTASLAPMEAEIYVLLWRLKDGAEAEKADLVRFYLDEYAARTGRTIAHDRFMARVVWAQFIQHLGRIAGCVKGLRWVPGVTGPRDYIHVCVELCERLLPQLPGD